jgi:hypothetical protein
MAYTSDGIMAQVLVAFGQGTGAMRVQHDAALALRDLYSKSVTPAVLEAWPTLSAQALERVRAVGRLAAAKAAGRGDTAINAGDVTSSASTVHMVSQTDLCPPGPPLSAGGPPAP